MLIRNLEAAMSESPMSESRNSDWTNSNDLHHNLDPSIGPPTPAQRRLGARVAMGIIVAALLAIILLDHYGILH
jgi:hypothetical protein